LYEAQLRFDVDIDMKLRSTMNAGLTDAIISYVTKHKKSAGFLKAYTAMEETAKKGKCVICQFLGDIVDRQLRLL